MKNFTPSQTAGIMSEDPTILCLAGPGSGKTTVLVQRITRIVAEKITWPGKMVAITFTNNSARELEERIAAETEWTARSPELKATVASGPGVRLGYVGTLHGFALKMLKERGACIGYGDRLSIISPESAADLLESKARQMGCKTKLADLMQWKAKGRPATQISDGIHPPQRIRPNKEELVVLSYYDELLSAGIVDFDILLEEFARLVTTTDALAGMFTHLFVDEVQDSARLDWKIYRSLPIANKFMVGDPDQAIYSFRGGEVSQTMAFAATPGVRTIVLEENFRSHSEICAAAQRLIERNLDRIPKRTISARGPGGKVEVMPEFMTEGEEIGAVARILNDLAGAAAARLGWQMAFEFSDMAILVRNNALAHAFRTTLAACGIPVATGQKSDLPRDWPFVRALIEFLVQPENDTLAFFLQVARGEKIGFDPQLARLGAHETRTKCQRAGISINAEVFKFDSGLPLSAVAKELSDASVSMESRMLVAEKMKELPAGATMLDLALTLAQTYSAEEEATEGVTVSTIHGAKGREWDVVFIVGLEDEVMPGNRKGTNVEEERRLCYVAATRARKALFLSHSASRVASWGPIVDHKASRFIKEMMP